MNAPRRKIPQIPELLSLLVALLLVLLIAVLTYRAWGAFRKENEETEIARRVVVNTNALLASMRDAETSQRGFLLTGQDSYLVPYRQALKDIPVILATLGKLTMLSGSSLEKMRPLIGGKLSELQQTISLRQQGQTDAALSIVREDRGKVLMDQIRETCADIQEIERARLAQFSEEARTSVNELGFISILGSAALFTLLVFSTITIQRGMSRRQRLIQALQQSEAQTSEARDWLQTTLGSIGDGVIATDAAGRVTLLNAVAQTLTGWKQDDALGKPLEEIFVITNEETGAAVENPVMKALREGRIVGLANHTRLTGKNGREIPIDDSAAPIRDAAGAVTGVVLVFRDVTERKEIEKAVQKNVNELRRANEDLSQFAFAASHDLQEPLRMITNYSQLLVKSHRGELGEEASVCVGFITDGTKRMRNLLADLLAYTRLSGDGSQPVLPVDLNSVFQKTLENCKAAIDETGAVVSSDPLPTITGHEPHFLQLLQNLIGNAIKYRSEKSPRVHVTAECEGDSWRFAVRDNGMGIDPEYHHRIFGVFKRLHGNLIPGSGIGLAICQRVVERYGGRIWVESQVDQGATFYFTLPTTNGAGA